MGPRLLLPQPKPPSGGPSTQESLVKRIMARRVLVRLMSPRAFSSRQLVGTPNDFVKLLRAQGSEFVGPAKIIDAAVEVVASGLGDHADHSADRPPKLRTVAVALNLEFFDGINGRIHKNGTLRTDVIIAGAVDEPLVGIHRPAADGQICTAFQTFRQRVVPRPPSHARLR